MDGVGRFHFIVRYTYVKLTLGGINGGGGVGWETE